MPATRGIVPVTRRSPHVNHVSGGQRVDPVVARDHEPALLVDVDRPSASRRATGQVDGHVPADRGARRAVVGEQPGRQWVAVSRAPGDVPRGQGRAGRRGARDRGRRPPTRRAAATSRPAPAARRREVETLMPMPTTTASPTTSARRPATLRSPTSTSLGHLRRASTSPSRLTVVATARPARSGSQPQDGRVAAGGRSSTEKVSAERSGAVHARSRRPRPATWCSATTTSPSGAPVAAAATTSALVEPVSSTTSRSRPQPALDDQRRAQRTLPQRGAVEVAEGAVHCVALMVTTRSCSRDSRCFAEMPGPVTSSSSVAGHHIG